MNLTPKRHSLPSAAVTAPRECIRAGVRPGLQNPRGPTGFACVAGSESAASVVYEASCVSGRRGACPNRDGAKVCALCSSSVATHFTGAQKGARIEHASQGDPNPIGPSLPRPLTSQPGTIQRHYRGSAERSRGRTGTAVVASSSCSLAGSGAGEPLPSSGLRGNHMKLSALAFCLALSSFVTSQSPPLGAHIDLGWINQTQAAGGGSSTAVAGEQLVGARCAVGDSATGTVGFGPPDGIKIGRRIWWWTTSTQVGVAPVTFHAAGSSPAVVFAVASFQFTSYPLPGAAAGFEMVFLPPGAVLVSPFTATQFVTGISPYTFTNVPAGGYDVQWLFFDVPNNPAIVGQVLDMQAVRIDPTNGLFYLSDEHLTEIRP